MKVGMKVYYRDREGNVYTTNTYTISDITEGNVVVEWGKKFKVKSTEYPMDTFIKYFVPVTKLHKALR